MSSHWDFIGTLPDGGDRVTFNYCKVSGGPLDGSVHELPEPMSLKSERGIYMVCNGHPHVVRKVVDGVAYISWLSPGQIDIELAKVQATTKIV